jgi:ATP/maltotriose-dependent transcriptional regulator MalT
LIEQTKGPACWLVLDNWEAVNDSREHSDLIVRLASSGRQHLRIIMGSRVKPAFSTRKFQESGQADIIEKDKL